MQGKCMDTFSSKSLVNTLLESAGITLNGNNPWDIRITHPGVYDRLLHEGALGLGESYMDAWWECDQIDALIERILLAKLENRIKKNKLLLFKFALSKIINMQTKQRALQVGVEHYDLGNTLFEKMLDRNMNYTCGYWKEATHLDEAQLAKMDLVCKKLFLKPGMRLLDIGCGFGSFAKHAAEQYGVEVVGVTISKEQQALAQTRCKGLPIEIRFQDYRDIKNETFDRVVSLGMFEHVGHLNYATYMKTAYEALNDEGLFLLHTIGSNVTVYSTNEWIEKYIFPNGMLPSIKQIGQAIEPYFIMEDWHNFGADYDKTLLAWHQNVNHHWDELKSFYNERFRRMWNFYLLSSAGGFRAREMQLWQIVLSKRGLKGGYQSIR